MDYIGAGLDRFLLYIILIQETRSHLLLGTHYQIK